jgi:zinc-ribbon domain/Putative adhesin
MPFCINCGATLPEQAKFCPNCGAPVSGSTRKNSDSFHQVFQVQGRPKVTIDVRTPGSIDVVRGSAGQVSVDAEVTDPETIDYSASQSGSVLTVLSRSKNPWNPMHWGSYVFSGGPRANIRVTAPAEADLSLETMTDPISIVGVSGAISAESKTGSVRLKDSGGAITVRTHTGNVDLDGVEGAGVDIRNTIGQVRFAGSLLPPSAGKSGDNSFRTTTGDIDVILKGQPDLSIDASTTVGHITCRLDMSESHYDRGEYVGQHVAGKVGAGTGKLRLEATTGSITISKQ